MRTHPSLELRFQGLNKLQEGHASLGVPLLCTPELDAGAIMLSLGEAIGRRDRLELEIAQTTIILTLQSRHQIQIIDLVSEVNGFVLKRPVDQVVWRRKGNLWVTEDNIRPGRTPIYLFFVGSVASRAYAKQAWLRDKETKL